MLDARDAEKLRTASANILSEIIKIHNNPMVTTDEHHTDQLMIYMALAKGESKIICHDLSLHSETMLELLRIYIPDIQISLEPVEGDKNTMIAIKGIGKEN